LDKHGPLAEIDPEVAKGLISKGYAESDALHPGRLQITVKGQNWYGDAHGGTRGE